MQTVATCPASNIGRIFGVAVDPRQLYLSSNHTVGFVKLI